MLERDESVALGLVCAVVSDHLGLLEAGVFAEGFRQQLV